MSFKSTIILLLIATVLYLLLLLSIYGLQKYIIFRPTSLNPDYIFQFNHPHEEVFLNTSDQHIINGLYFKTTITKRGVILYFHGNADNLKRWGNYHVDFTNRGYEIFMIDYRGFGKTKGALSEQKFYEDSKVAYDYVRQTNGADSIIIYGRSLGCAMASELATRVPAKKLILETPFDNIRNEILAKTPLLVLPWDLKYSFPNDEYIPQVPYPIIIFEAAKDKLVPNRVTENLIPLLKEEDEFIKIDSAGHKNLSEFDQYQIELTRILHN